MGHTSSLLRLMLVGGLQGKGQPILLKSIKARFCHQQGERHLSFQYTNYVYEIAEKTLLYHIEGSCCVSSSKAKTNTTSTVITFSATNEV